MRKIIFGVGHRRLCDGQIDVCAGNVKPRHGVRIHLIIFKKVVAAQKAVLVELGFGNFGNIAAVTARGAAVAARGLRCIDGDYTNAEYFFAFYLAGSLDSRHTAF